jgi:hypothetical protein
MRFAKAARIYAAQGGMVTTAAFGDIVKQGTQIK